MTSALLQGQSDRERERIPSIQDTEESWGSAAKDPWERGSRAAAEGGTRADGVGRVLGRPWYRALLCYGFPVSGPVC